MPVEWLGAHNPEEVVYQLETEPKVECVMIGGGLDDSIRGELIGIIAQRRPDICIYVKDRASGPRGLAPFVRRLVEHDLHRLR